MNQSISRIVFATGSGTIRAAMAKGIVEYLNKDKNITVDARGLIVQFPEPMNQKVEAVLASKGIVLEDYVSTQLAEEDFCQNTLVFVMEEDQRQKVLETYENATEDNTFVLSAYVGEELETMNPYGGTLQTYGLCFEMLQKTIEKLLELL